ncbi:MAG: hypothetical protein ABI120_25550, partial [Gemmatimonadaceae bacterium]
TGGSYAERDGYVFDMIAGANLRRWKNLALTGAASFSNSLKNGSDLTSALVNPSNGGPLQCGAHMPDFTYGAAMVGLQTNSAEPVLFAIATGPAYVHGSPKFPSSNTIDPTQNAFGMQSRMDIAIRELRPVWINFAVKSLLMPNYRDATLHNKSATVGIRLQ